MPIQITTQPLKLDVTIQKGSLSQSGNNSRVLNTTSDLPKLQIQSSKANIEIDQSQCFAEAGLKNLKAMIEDSISYGMQMLNKGISRIVSDGNVWSNIQNGSDPIPDQAIYNAYEQFEKEFNYTAIPQSRPKITVAPGEINYQFRPGHINSNSNPRPVKMNYKPWKVQYAVKQYNRINIQYNKSNVSFSA